MSQANQHYPAGGPGMLGTILRAMATVREQNLEPKHLKCATATWDAAKDASGLQHSAMAGSFESLFGVPVFIDDTIEPGKWEVGAGPRPQPEGCVDFSKDADTKCHQCGGPWCGECKAAMKGRHEHHPCHTCRNGDDW